MKSASSPTDATELVLDINGYFVAATDPECAAVLSHDALPSSGYAHGTWARFRPRATAANVARELPILTSTCHIPTTATAYSLNFTAVPPAPLGFITAWPSDQIATDRLDPERR